MSEVTLPVAAPLDSARVVDSFAPPRMLDTSDYREAIRASQRKIGWLALLIVVCVFGLFFASYSQFFSSLRFERPAESEGVVFSELDVQFRQRDQIAEAVRNADNIIAAARKTLNTAVSLEALLDTPKPGVQELAMRWSSFQASVPISTGMGRSTYSYIGIGMGQSSDPQGRRTVSYNLSVTAIMLGQDRQVVTNTFSIHDTGYQHYEAKSPEPSAGDYFAKLDPATQKRYIAQLRDVVKEMADMAQQRKDAFNAAIQETEKSIHNLLKSASNTDVTYISGVFNRVLSVFSIFVIISVSLRMITAELKFMNSITHAHLGFSYFEASSKPTQDFISFYSTFGGAASAPAQKAEDGASPLSIIDSMAALADKVKALSGRAA